MFDLTPDQDDLFSFLLLDLLLGVVAVAAGLVQLLWSRPPRGFARATTAVLLSALALAAVLDDPNGLGLVRRLVLVAGLVAAGCVSLCRAPVRHWVGLVAPAAALLLACRASWFLADPPPLIGPSLEELDAEFVHQHFPTGAIRTAAPDPSYNCHDWALGPGMITDSAGTVRHLLRRGLRQVQRPRPGDVVVYAGPNGQVWHSGIVKAVGNNFVLVESKWGDMGRYLHPAEVPSLATRPIYFRRGSAGQAATSGRSSVS